MAVDDLIQKTIFVDKDVERFVTRVAEEQKRSFSQQVNFILSQWHEEQK